MRNHALVLLPCSLALAAIVTAEAAGPLSASPPLQVPGRYPIACPTGTVPGWWSGPNNPSFYLQSSGGDVHVRIQNGYSSASGTQTIPFFQSVFTRVNSGEAAIGWGWFSPDNTGPETVHGPDQVEDWYWVASSDYFGIVRDPAIEAYCYYEYQVVADTLKEAWVVAWRDWSVRGAAIKRASDEGTYSAQVAGEGDVCYEMYYWWIDSAGFHERLIASWCEGDDEWET